MALSEAEEEADSVVVEEEDNEVRLSDLTLMKADQEDTMMDLISEEAT